MQVAERPKNRSANELFGCLRVLWDPQKVFSSVAENPVIWAPYLAWMLLATVAALISLPHLMSITPNSSTVQNAMAVAYVGAAFRGIVSPWLKGPIFASLLMFFGLFLGRGAHFKTYLSIVGYAQIPVMIGGVVTSLVSLSATTLAAASHISLGLLVAFPDAKGAAYAVLSNLNLFGLWGLTLLVTGFAVLNAITPRKAIWLGLVWFVLSFATSWLGALFTVQ